MRVRIFISRKKKWEEVGLLTDNDLFMEPGALIEVNEKLYYLEAIKFAMHSVSKSVDVEKQLYLKEVEDEPTSFIEKN